MTKIVLATSSKVRKRAFSDLNIEFVSQDSKVDENFKGRPDNPQELVRELSKRKAQAVAKNYPDSIVIGFDSVGWFMGNILEKPASKEEAFDTLRTLSGTVHRFYTGIHIIDNLKNSQVSEVAETKVQMRNLKDSEIAKYLDDDGKFNTYAVGYDAHKRYSSTFVAHIEGSYNNLIRGVPLEKVVQMLYELGYEIWH